MLNWFKFGFYFLLLRTNLSLYVGYCCIIQGGDAITYSHGTNLDSGLWGQAMSMFVRLVAQ